MEDDSQEEKSGCDVGSCVKRFTNEKAGAAADASAVAGVIARDAE